MFLSCHLGLRMGQKLRVNLRQWSGRGPREWDRNEGVERRG